MLSYDRDAAAGLSRVELGIHPVGVFAEACNRHVNRTPLFSRAPKWPVGSPQFLMTNDNYRAGQPEPKVPQATTQYCLKSSVSYNNEQSGRLAVSHVASVFEHSFYYGHRERGTKGLDTIIQTNRVSAPINANGYKPSDFVRDTIEACAKGGGNPTIILVSTNFQTGFAVWGHAAQRVNAGANVFGEPIDVFRLPFMSDVSIIESPLMERGTAICLSGNHVRIRIRKPMTDDGRVISMEGAIELDNEAHHAFVSGVESFSAA